MILLRRPIALATVLALVATLLGGLTAGPAQGAPNVFVRDRLVNGEVIQTYRIEVPHTTVERWEERVLENGSINCIHQVYRVLDTEYLSQLPNSSWTDYPNGAFVPSTIGWYSPNAPDSYGSSTVVDMAAVSASAGYSFGGGLGINVRSFATTLRDGCSQYRVPLGDLPVPIVGASAHGADLQVSFAPVEGQPNTWTFTADAQHPVIGDLPLEFAWEFERQGYQEGREVTHTFVSEDATSFWHRRWQVRVTSPGIPNQIDSEQGWLQSLDVALTRGDDGPVLVGEEFEVDLTVSSPSDSPSPLTGVVPMGEALTLPDWLEVISTPDDLADPFSLAPGEERSGTYRLRATTDGDGDLEARWRGSNAAGLTVEGAARLPLRAVGTFEGDWFRTDPASQGVKKDETAPLRLRVDNSTGRDLTEVQLVEAEVAGVGESPGEARLADATAPHEGQDAVRRLADQLAADGPASVGFQDYTLEGVAEGDVVLRALVRGTDPDGNVVEGTIEEEWTVRSTDLTVEITFDPEDRVQEESDDPEAPPQPVEMTATVSLTNTSGGPLTDVTIEEFEVSRLIGEQQLWLEQVGGQRLTNWDAAGILLEQPTGTDAPLEPFDLEAEEVKTFTAEFIVRDDGQLDFHVLALAADGAGQTVRGFGESSWVLSPEKYLEVITDVALPQPGERLPAGQDVVITGRVVNLSQTATLEVGPLIPILSGNTGQVSLAYGGARAPDPRQLPAIPGRLQLGPGDSELFEIAVATGYSDPRTNVETGEPEVAPTGGTRAYFEFEPWAIATEADGTVRVVRTDPQTDQDRGVKISDEHRELTASIDDSIAIPETDYALLAGGIGVGVVTGIGRAGVGLVTGAVDALKLPFTLTTGAMEYQSRVWNAFTEEERRLYSEDLGVYLVAMAVGNVENGLKDADQLKDDLNEMVYQEMTRLANEWETGDYVSTAEAYAAGGSEIAASLWLPAGMTKLAQTPRAAAALTRAQNAVNLRMAPVLDAARQIRYVEDALPLLRALENGAEISADAMRTMYGVSPEEVAELQRLAAKYDVLLTFRSRHPSSIQWIERFGAMMKPEAIKIKSVSEMDVQLGYREGDLGSVVFRKPEVLRRAGDGADDATLEALTSSFVRDRGFVPGTKEYDSAKDRVALRIREWREHEAAYRAYDRRGFIPTEFDYEGNAIPDLRSPSSRNRQTGFELDEVGDDEYIVRLLDPTDGEFKRVTGDIDPIAFTNLDGSPLTTAQHRDLINEMRSSSLLRAQHPESATFVGVRRPDGSWKKEPGLDFIEEQFKPGEAAAQIGPEGPARAVRLNKGRSEWNDSFDYRLHWEGGYQHVGGRGRIGQRTDIDRDFGRDVEVEVPERLRFKPLQLGRDGEATFGRATIKGVATGTGTAVFVGDAGELIEVLADGSTRPYEGNATIFEAGDPVTLEIAPAGQVESTTGGVERAALVSLSGAIEPELSGAPGSAVFSLASDEQPATTTQAQPAMGVVLVDDGGPMLFAPGQVVAVGVQDGQGDLHTIASVDGREIRFTEFAEVAVDDIIVMVQAAPVESRDPADPDDPDDADDPDVPDDPREGDDPAPGSSEDGGQPGTDAPDSAVSDPGTEAPAAEVLDSVVTRPDDTPLAASPTGDEAAQRLPRTGYSGVASLLAWATVLLALGLGLLVMLRPRERHRA